jgi:hypothetical protein
LRINYYKECILSVILKNMTVFASSTDLPSAINSLEKLAMWVGLLMTRINPTIAILEDPGYAPERMCQAQIRRCDDGKEYCIVRISIPLDEAYKSDITRKLWTFASDISNVSIPTGFKSN